MNIALANPIRENLPACIEEINRKIKRRSDIINILPFLEPLMKENLNYLFELRRNYILDHENLMADFEAFLKVKTRADFMDKRHYIMYKFLNPDLTSPYRRFQYSIGEFAADIDRDESIQHSYGLNVATLEWIHLVLTNSSDHTFENTVLARCLIPKTTELDLCIPAQSKGKVRVSRMILDKVIEWNEVLNVCSQCKERYISLIEDHEIFIKFLGKKHFCSDECKRKTLEKLKKCDYCVEYYPAEKGINDFYCSEECAFNHQLNRCTNCNSKLCSKDKRPSFSEKVKYRTESPDFCSNECKIEWFNENVSHCECGAYYLTEKGYERGIGRFCSYDCSKNFSKCSNCGSVFNHTIIEPSEYEGHIFCSIFSCKYDFIEKYETERGNIKCAECSKWREKSSMVYNKFYERYFCNKDCEYNFDDDY